MVLVYAEVNSAMMIKGPKMKAKITQLKFRIPSELKPKLERAARENKRSVNMEVTARLEQSFRLEQSYKAGGKIVTTAQTTWAGELERLEEIDRQLVLVQMRLMKLEENRG